MNGERTRRVGHNQALYRKVNERIEDLNEAFGVISGNFVIVCECGDLNCIDDITVSREVYERARSDPSRFIVKPGHEAHDLERVVERDGDYFVIEKAIPVGRRLAEETDPRS